MDASGVFKPTIQALETELIKRKDNGKVDKGRKHEASASPAESGPTIFVTCFKAKTGKCYSTSPHDIRDHKIEVVRDWRLNHRENL